MLWVHLLLVVVVSTPLELRINTFVDTVTSSKPIGKEFEVAELREFVGKWEIENEAVEIALDKATSSFLEFSETNRSAPQEQWEAFGSFTKVGKANLVFMNDQKPDGEKSHLLGLVVEKNKDQFTIRFASAKALTDAVSRGELLIENKEAFEKEKKGRCPLKVSPDVLEEYLEKIGPLKLFSEKNTELVFKRRK